MTFALHSSTNLAWNLASAVDLESRNAVFEAEFGTFTVASVSTLNVLLLLFPSFILMDDIFLTFYPMPRGYKLTPQRSKLSDSGEGDPIQCLGDINYHAAAN